MAEFTLYVLKLNLLAAVMAALALLVSRLTEKRYSVRWKYILWIVISVVLLFPVKPPSGISGIHIEIPADFVVIGQNSKTMDGQTAGAAVRTDGGTASAVTDTDGETADTATRTS